MANPTHRSPRIQVTLTPEVMALLEELSQLTGQGKATMVSELMTETLPMLIAARDAIRLVKDAPREAQALLAKQSNEAMMKLAQVQLEFDDLLSKQPKPKHQKRKKGPPDGTP